MMPCGGCSKRGGVLLCVTTTPETFGDGGIFSVTGAGCPDEMPAWLCARTPVSCRAIPSITGATLRGKYARLTQSMPSPGDRKSTRLNSSHTVISYAVFCLKKKKKQAPTEELLRMSWVTNCCSSHAC